MSYTIEEVERLEKSEKMVKSMAIMKDAFEKKLDRLGIIPTQEEQEAIDYVHEAPIKLYQNLDAACIDMKKRKSPNDLAESLNSFREVDLAQKEEFEPYKKILEKLQEKMEAVIAQRNAEKVTKELNESQKESSELENV